MIYIGGTIFRKLHCSISAVIQNEVHTSLIPGLVSFFHTPEKEPGYEAMFTPAQSHVKKVQNT